MRPVRASARRERTAGTAAWAGTAARARPGPVVRITGLAGCPEPRDNHPGLADRRSRCNSVCAARSAAACSSSVRPGAPARSFFVARTVAVSCVSSAATRSATAASRSAAGTTASASRSSRASAAPTIRVVRHISIARGRPTMSTSGFVPARSGTRPNVGSFIQSTASSARTRRSQARASWKPAPRACPRTAATETMSGRCSHRNPACSPASHSPKSGLSGSASGSSPGTPSGVNSRRSIPAEKDGPSPRTTTARTCAGSVSPMSARPRHMPGVIALRRSGRCSVTVATVPSMSSRSPTDPGSAAPADLGCTVGSAFSASTTTCCRGWRRRARAA